jgi:hypothetical protein
MTHGDMPQQPDAESEPDSLSDQAGAGRVVGCR